MTRDRTSMQKLTRAGEFATNVIMAYGGGNWARQILEYGAGLNKAGIAKFQASDGQCRLTSYR